MNKYGFEGVRAPVRRSVSRVLSPTNFSAQTGNCGEATIHLGQWLPNCLVATYPNDGPKTGLAASRARLESFAVGIDGRSYLVLLPVGFTMPALLPAPRWALTPPFHPYPESDSGRFAFCGTFPEVTLAGR